MHLDAQTFCTRFSGNDLAMSDNPQKIEYLASLSWMFLKLTREELQQMEQRIRKLLTMYKVLHPREIIEKLYMSRKEGGRDLISIEDNVNASIRWLEDYIYIYIYREREREKETNYCDHKQHRQRQNQ